MDDLDVPASLAGIAQVLGDFEPDFLGLRTCLDADVWCSSLLASMVRERVLSDAEVRAELALIVGAVVRLVHRAPTWAALAFLRAAAMAVPWSEQADVESAAAFAVASGIPEPSWARREPLVAGPCWHAESPGLMDLVALTFERGEESHVITVEVVSPGVITDIIITPGGLDERRAQRAVARRAGLSFDDLTPLAARGRLEPALAVAPQFRDLLDEDRVADRVADLLILLAHLSEAFPPGS